jgi:hypothetical protein
LTSAGESNDEDHNTIDEEEDYNYNYNIGESTGWISHIWKNVQVNIHYTYTTSTETNNTSAKSPGFQL